MSADTTGDTGRSAGVDAVQAVVDRVISWQEAAPDETVREELVKGLDDVGVEVPAGFVDDIVRRISDGTEHIDVAPLLAADETS